MFPEISPSAMPISPRQTLPIESSMVSRNCKPTLCPLNNPKGKRFSFLKLYFSQIKAIVKPNIEPHWSDLNLLPAPETVLIATMAQKMRLSD